MEVKAEIAGLVLKFEVKEGDRVGENDTIATLESMKMEIPVLAPAGGEVTRILVNEGDVVAEGTPLLVINP